MSADPIYNYVKGKGWVVNHTDSFVTELRNGKEVTCYYRRPEIGEWYTDFGHWSFGYATEDGKLNAKGIKHINTCTYGYRHDGSHEEGFGWQVGMRYLDDVVYVTIVPND